MHGYLTHIRMNLRLMMRNRMALIFSVLFPLLFFFGIGQFGNARGPAAQQIVAMVLMLGAVGSGLFGVGIRATMDREQNILRRFKVAPISPGPILVSAMVSSICLYLPISAGIITLAHLLYGMPLPTAPISLALLLICGLMAFAAIGSIVASIANSMQESQLLIQLFYFPSIFLGGVVPLTVFPEWLQIAANFFPTPYFSTALQPIMAGRETILDNLPAVGVLLATAGVAGFISVKLFRWEKEEKIKPKDKLWVLAVLAPIFIMGAWQMQSRANLTKAAVLERETARSRIWLIRDARLFLGNGQIIDRGSVLIRDGKIARLWDGAITDADVPTDATPINAAGMTLLPGLIDAHVHLSANGLFSTEPQDPEDAAANAINPADMLAKNLDGYLYSGVTAVKSLGDPLDAVLQLRDEINTAQRLGAEVFAVGPMFTTEGGHGTESLEYIPELYRDQLIPQFLRMPTSPAEARQQVDELAARHVDGIKAILDAGGGTTRYNRMDTAILDAIVAAAHENDLPVVVHTGGAMDVADSLAAGADGVEHGSARDLISEDLLAAIQKAGMAYDPTLAVVESVGEFGAGTTGPLDRVLVGQVASQEQLDAARQAMNAPVTVQIRESYASYPFDLDIAGQNLLNAYAAGVPLTLGTDSGNPLLVHGPAIHRELQLWVAAGIPPQAALEAATYGNAHLLGVADRIGQIQEGYEASLLLVEGNPLEDITATERIFSVFFKGENVNRRDLISRD